MQNSDNSLKHSIVFSFYRNGETIPVSVCDMPKAEGACNGAFPRYFYNSKTGHCEAFEYSGCLGNQNRFLTMNECTNRCAHKMLEFRRTQTCRQPKYAYDICQNDTAIWSYDYRTRRCVPTYCADQSNSFETKGECEAICPRVFAPQIDLISGPTLLLEKGTKKAEILVTIRANPEANLTWFLNAKQIQPDRHFKVIPDGRLIIHKVSELDAGEYRIVAENGIGNPARKSVIVTVFPLDPVVSIEVDKLVYQSGETVELKCTITAYPIPDVQWHKVDRKGGRVVRKLIRDDYETEGKYAMVAHQVSELKTLSRLRIFDVTTQDSGNYQCTGSNGNLGFATQGVSVRFEGLGECVDRPTFSHCDQVVKHKYCGNKYYGIFCCKSCTEAGMVPGGFS